MSLERKKVAEVAQNNIYPVKGMQGIEMEAVMVRSISVVGDRRYAFTITDSKAPNTLLETIRFPGLLRYAPFLQDPTKPKTSEVIIKTPEGEELSIHDKMLLEQIEDESNCNLILVSMGRGFYHSMPVSLLSMGSVKEIERHVGKEVDPRRFRMNLILETFSDIPYEEDSLIGKLLVFGDRDDSAVLSVVKPDPRCHTVNLDPESGAANNEVLKAIATHHNNNLGVYCTLFKEGVISAKAPVYLVNIDY